MQTGNATPFLQKQTKSIEKRKTITHLYYSPAQSSAHPIPILHRYSTAAMPAAASGDNDVIRTGERDEAVEGVDDRAWDVFDYFGEL